MDKEEERVYWARVVREIQHLSGMTLQQLADYLNVDARNVKYWKSGHRRPTGIVTVRLYEYRRALMLGTVVHSIATGVCITS